MLHGIGVSHGIVRGVLYRETTFVPVISREEIAPEGRPGQAQKYKDARQSAEEELQKLLDSLQAQGADKAAIFAAHQEILLDEAMEEEILETIGEGQSADSAVEDVYRAYAKRIARAKDPVIRERAQDLDDVRLRLLRNLQGVPDDVARTVSASQPRRSGCPPELPGWRRQAVWPALWPKRAAPPAMRLSCVKRWGFRLCSAWGRG